MGPINQKQNLQNLKQTIRELFINILFRCGKSAQILSAFFLFISQRLKIKKLIITLITVSNC